MLAQTVLAEMRAMAGEIATLKAENATLRRTMEVAALMHDDNVHDAREEEREKMRAELDGRNAIIAALEAKIARGGDA